MNRRFFCNPLPAVGATVELSDEESHHVRDVLRGREGEELVLLDGQGGLAQARIVESAGRRRPILCEILSCSRAPKPRCRYDLYVAPPRGKLMPGIIRAATELGVGRVCPILCERSESRPDGDAPEAWPAAAIAACKQSANTWCPEILDPVELASLDPAAIAPGLLGWSPTDGPAAENSWPVEPVAVSLFIGPEGGFSPTEIERLLHWGLLPVSFGRWILRVETAVIAGLSRLNQRYPL